jgi:cholesterol oxidase
MREHSAGGDDAFDVVVVGSGFGGSVAALRLSEKGYRVVVLEAGRRFTDATLPRTSWDLRGFLWAPALGLYGMQRIHLLRNVLVLAGAGVGGGSLNYAQTLYEPLPAFYEDPQWRHITDWRAELAPYYAQARRMLGVTVNPTLTPSDEMMRRVAEELGVGQTFRLTPVGVCFGRDGREEPGVEVGDPYFGGVGPSRTGCIQCGECMTGCRHGAKNRLDKNYLWLAERAGCAVHPMTTVTAVRPLPGGGYAVETRPTSRRRRRPGDRVYRAPLVVLAAGTWGTQRLLHEMRDTGVLPRLSPRLGHLTRTNSESILGARSLRPDADFTRGVAITSSFHPDPVTHVEPVRYGKGSNAMGLLQAPMTDGTRRTPRVLQLLAFALRHPVQFLRVVSVRRWSERSIIVLVMQSLDNSLRVFRRRGLFGPRLSSTQGHGAPNPTTIPVGNRVTQRLARLVDGIPAGSWGEVFDVPLTAHFLGGCPIGESAETGVVDPYHRVHGHEGLYVVDGAAVTANLGVNPSLTITAQAERAMALVPNKGEADPRPPPGAPYRRLPPVAPRHPVVPAGAPGALSLG